ncbi:MAG TPA: hypothetical protein PLE61_00465 [Vicinamibacterales bacterium]|nr:hypothetical protein [Vicinamibacterales bacterium]HPW19261.1 hypothetical protein [Vicinamibacterales bacterium]
MTAAAGAAPEQPGCADLDGKRTCCERFGTGARETFCLLNGLAASVRDIATPPGLSIGGVCHHSPDKETVFETPLDQHCYAIDDPGFPVNRALRTGSFPESREDIGRTARETVSQNRRRVALICVDAVEFEGRHIRESCLHHFAVELVFGAPDHCGKDPDASIAGIAGILRHGMLRPRA